MKKLVGAFVILLTILILSALVIGCEQNTNNSNQTYTNEELGFSCQYPADWDLKEGLMGALVVFIGPENFAEDRLTNVNIFKETLSDEITFEDYVARGEVQLKAFMPEYSNLYEQAITVSNLPAFERIFTAIVDDIMVKEKQVFFIKDNDVYIVTFVHPPESYDNYIYSLDLIISTLKFE